MKKFIKNGLLLFCFALCIFLTNCSPQKRINRILNRHPELKRDTVYTIHDTTFTKSFSYDTLYNYTHSRDTVVIERKNVQVKIYHTNDTIYLKTNVRPDTIIKQIKVPIRQMVYTIDERKQWSMFWLGSALVLFLLALIWLVLKWIKP